MMSSCGCVGGLFYGVIAMSGNALCSWSVVPRADERVRQLGRKVGCPTANPHAFIECLKKTKIDVILRAQKEMWVWAKRKLISFL